MDDLEDRADAADDRKPKADREWEPTGDRQDEKPAVEPFDPYFGRRKAEKFSWF